MSYFSFIIEKEGYIWNQTFTLISLFPPREILYLIILQNSFCCGQWYCYQFQPASLQDILLLFMRLCMFSSVCILLTLVEIIKSSIYLFSYFTNSKTLNLYWSKTKKCTPIWCMMCRRSVNVFFSEQYANI